MCKRDFENTDELLQLLERIAKESPTFQRIALYIEKNYLKVVFLTASELAGQMGVSQGSVSRFFMTLGYHGYNDFLRNLQQVVSEQLTAPRRLAYSCEGGHQKWNGMLDKEIQNILALEDILQEKASKKLLELLRSPTPLYLVSARMSATILPYIAYILKKMRENVFIATPGTMEWEQLELRQPADTNILVVSFPRYANELIRKGKELSQRGFSLHLVTDSRLSPLNRYADEAVFINVITSSLFDSYSAPLAYFNLLLRETAAGMPGIQERLEALEEIEERHHVYFTKRT